MFDHRRAGERALAFIITVFTLATALAAPPAADRDTREVNAYVLTEAALARYTQATRKLQALPQRAAASCTEGGDEGGDGEDDGNGKSIAAQVAQLEASPGAAAAVKSAGLTTREYVVFGWSLLQAGLASWAIAQPGGKLPAGVLRSNVDFYRAHEAAIKAAAPASRSEECEDERDTEG